MSSKLIDNRRRIEFSLKSLNNGIHELVGYYGRIKEIRTEASLHFTAFILRISNLPRFSPGFISRKKKECSADCKRTEFLHEKRHSIFYEIEVDNRIEKVKEIE